MAGYSIRFVHKINKMKKNFKNKISIVIATLNSENTIHNLIKSLKNTFPEIIIIDANSRDGTIKICKKYTNKIYYSSPGRGLQLHIGSKKSNSEWILFLHSDSVLDPNCIEKIDHFIKNLQNVNKAGVFKLKVDHKNYIARIIEKYANARSKLLGLPYGDQGLLISRNFYNKIGGYKPLSIMEDVNIIRTIGPKNISILEAYIKTSPENYIKDGWIIRSFKNIFCLILYFFKFNNRTIYKIYYGNKTK